MKNRSWLLVFVSVLALVLVSVLALGSNRVAQAQVSELVIDDFKGATAINQTVPLNGTATLRRTSAGHIVGDTCRTDIGVTPVEPGGNGRATVLEIPTEGPMYLESGAKSAFGLTHYYGEDENGNAHPLGLTLQSDGYDRFRIEFDSSDVALDYLVEVFDGNGNVSFLNGSESTVERGLPFNADFRFADFPAGSPGPINWDNIDYIVVLFQTGNAVGSADFVVNRVVAIPEPTPTPSE